MGQFDFVKILSTSNSKFKGNTKFLQVTKNLGMVDVTVYRRVYFQKDQNVSLYESDYANNKQIALAIEGAILEVNEIIKSKVAAINGNCI